MNFRHDPVTCAIAVGWAGEAIETVPLQSSINEDILRSQQVSDGRNVHVLVDIDTDAFSEAWLTSVETASSR